MRRQPVAFALIDAAFLADSKWRKLGKRLPEPTAFNSALGAWLRILTAARRNGLPDVNSQEEAEDPTYLGDLIAVGLLTETGIPEKPYRAWGPARPRYPSDGAPSATNAPNATSAPQVVGGADSPPLPSLQLPSKEDGGSGGDGVSADARDAWWTLMGTYPSGRTKDWIGELVNEFDDERVSAALAKEAKGDRQGILGRVRDRLRSEADKAEKARALARQEKLEKEAAAKHITPELAEERRRRVQEEIRKMLPSKSMP